MGNWFCPESKTSEPGAKGGPAPAPAVIVRRERRPSGGVAGLRECGFEYRPVKEYDDSDDGTKEGSPRSSSYYHRLLHVESGSTVTAANKKLYVPDGSRFEEVSEWCQDVAREQLLRDNGGRLRFVTLTKYQDRHPIQAIVSKDWDDYGGGENENGDDANTDNDHCNDDQNGDDESVLIVITGKGLSRAGVMSVKEIVVSGIERGSADYHVRRAFERDWGVVLLDPNALGPSLGNAVVDASLDAVLSRGGSGSKKKRPIYVLAHSAAGGYLVRYLLEGRMRRELLARLRRVVMTDSTHNVQWARHDAGVRAFLQEPGRILYVRNCSENPSDTFADHRHKRAGDPHVGNVWWHRRFGDVPTVWAGTPDHSAMCWVARKVIWNFLVDGEVAGTAKAAAKTTRGEDEPKYAAGG